MIIAHLAGGLGNQMFQYAMARQIALGLGAELKLDLFSYRLDRLRTFGLDHLAVEAFPAGWGDIFCLCPGTALSRLAPRPLYERGWLWLRKLGLKPRCRVRIVDSVRGPVPLRHGRIVAERQLTYDPEVRHVPDNSLLIGWWQHEAYFSEIRPRLLREFQVKAPPSDLDAQLLGQMASGDSVAVHLRRDDKVGRAEFKATSLAYCRQAMAIMRRRLSRPHFFIFSDSPEWTRQNLAATDDVTLVTHHDKHHPHLDLRLMTACRHQIIAASSLSWWAAWLNEHPGKIVISLPGTHWIQAPGYDTSQIIPPSWIVLDVPGD